MPIGAGNNADAADFYSDGPAPGADYGLKTNGTGRAAGTLIEGVARKWKALHNVSAGDLLGISQDYAASEQYVSRAANDRIKEDAAASVDIQSNYQSSHNFMINSDKFVIFGNNATTSTDREVAVVTIDKTSNPMTLNIGTKITKSGSYSARTLWGCKLDNDKFVIAYNKTNVDNNLYFTVCTVSGTTITQGTEQSVATTGSTSPYYIHCDQLDTDKFAFCYVDSTGQHVGVATVSGTVCTFGSTVNRSNSIYTTSPGVVKISTSSFLFCPRFIYNSSASTSEVTLCTVSGTTVTMGTSTSWSATNNTVRDVIPFSSGTKAIISGSSKINILSFSGTTITAGTEDNGGDCWLQEVTAGSEYIGYVEGNISAYRFTVSGTTVTRELHWNVSAQQTQATFSYFNDMRFYYKPMVNPADGFLYSMYSFPSTTTNWYWGSTGMANRFIGVATSSVSAGVNATVLVRGVDTNQTGLMPGANYEVDMGHLVITTPYDQDPLGNVMLRALSDTDLLL